MAGDLHQLPSAAVEWPVPRCRQARLPTDPWRCVCSGLNAGLWDGCGSSRSITSAGDLVTGVTTNPDLRSYERCKIRLAESLKPRPANVHMQIPEKPFAPCFLSSGKSRTSEVTAVVLCGGECGLEIRLSVMPQTVNNSGALLHSRQWEFLCNSAVVFAGQREPGCCAVSNLLMPPGTCV